MMGYQNLCYRYVAQLSFNNSDDVLLLFLLSFFAKLKIHPKHPEIEIVTDGY